MGSEQFRYIKSEFNPADALARGIEAGDLQIMPGPPFLRLPETEWPQFQDNEQSPHQVRVGTSKDMTTTTKQTQVDKRGKLTREFHSTSAPAGKENSPISFVTCCKDALHSKRSAESWLTYIVLMKLQDAEPNQEAP